MYFGWGVSVRRNANLARWNRATSDWSLFELSIFDHARRSLKLQGVEVELECGVTDEGDPWLVFCNVETGDVLGHFARIGDDYVACVPFHCNGLTSVILPDVLAPFLPRLLHTAASAQSERPMEKIEK
jgi:hypothetical protein